MRSRLLLVPAAIVAAAPASATTYMSIEKAQALMMPGATFADSSLTLNQQQYNAIIDAGNVQPYGRRLKVWKASTGGWFVVDRVLGRNDWITYAVAMDAEGVVQRVEILECVEKWDEIRQPKWLAQFKGKKPKSGFSDVQIISGSTLSSEQVVAGVKRLVSIYQIVLVPLAATQGTSQG